MRKIRTWLPLVVATTIMSMAIFAVAQQVMRQNLNDPQIQIAEDAAILIGNGTPVTDLIPSGSRAVDARASLSPFVIIYDESGKVVAGNGVLDGDTPILPPGVLDAARQTGQDRITWQPVPGVRLATVVQHVASGQGGFVLAARNMHEVESRIMYLEIMVGLAWLATIIITLGLALLA